MSMIGKKKRPGRTPWVPAEERMIGRNITLRPRELEWLEEQAERRGVTVSQVLRELVAGAMTGSEAALPPEAPLSVGEEK